MSLVSLTGLVVLVPLLASGSADKHTQHRQEPQIRAPGYSALKFSAPEPGSYALPSLGQAADGSALDDQGEHVQLRDLYKDKVTVLSFIYTSCPDVNGCPLAAFVLKQVQNRIMSSDSLSDKARLISLSFDPLTDSPDVMLHYGNALRADGFDWKFLTSESEAALEPILESYNQSVIRDYDADGRYLGTISHILRVYLIDRQGRIRNIYSPSFLHADIVVADIETLLSEAR
jgi:cytochrome oxidase Cu insertion factor (SCO1/SenC/PrrC family)